MTKEQLQAENERLGKEIAALRELLTVIAEGKHPMYRAGHHDSYYMAGSDRMVAVAGAVKAAMDNAGTGDFTMTLRAMAGYLRNEFARPLGYEPAPAADSAVITDSERTCDERNPDGSGEPCHRGGDHGVHRDSNGGEWRTDASPVGRLVIDAHDDSPEPRCTRPECRHHAAEHSNIENGECLVVLCPCARLELPEDQAAGL